MQEINQLKLSGAIRKIYEIIYTPAGVAISRFVLEHSSKQQEANLERLVRCKVFCVQVASSIPERWLNKQVSVTGFLAMNAHKSLVFHVNNIQILD